MSYSEIDIKEYIDKFSTRADRSYTVFTTLKSIGKSFKKTRDTWIPGSCVPVIAGGAIRDLVLGYYPKDYDCFLNPNSEDLDEDDTISLFMGELCTDRWDEKAAPEYFSKQFTETTFAVYEGAGKDNGEIVQLIHRSFESPPELVDTFDYDLVKAYYDPETDKFYAHPGFLESLKSKEIRYDNEKTRQRLNNWKYRNGIGSFVFIDKIKRKKEPYNWKAVNEYFNRKYHYTTSSTSTITGPYFMA